MGNRGEDTGKMGFASNDKKTFFLKRNFFQTKG